MKAVPNTEKIEVTFSAISKALSSERDIDMAKRTPEPPAVRVLRGEKDGELNAGR